jgi:hypothetical protein
MAARYDMTFNTASANPARNMAKSLCSLEVDHQLDFDSLLDRQISRLFAF